MKKNLLYLLIFLFCTGCATVSPFRRVELLPVKGISSVEAKQSFAKKIPAEFQILNSVEFKSYWRSFYSLGCLEINRAKNEFALAAMSPSGVKLFQITDKDDNVKYSCTVKQAQKLAPFANYIAQDIKNIYFDNIPPNSAKILKKENKIVFIKRMGDEKIRYVFGGAGSNLLRKALVKKRSWFWRLFLSDYYKVWTVDYFGYKTKNGKLYPENIFYENNTLNYQLIIRLKDVVD